MKIVLQRVTHASVTVDGETVGAIEKGFLLLLGVADSDTREIADKLVDKISKLRIFEDENGKTNLSLADAAGEVLVVSQFTLYADCKKGNRPSFAKAGKPETARTLYEYVVERFKEKFGRVEHGSFGAHMEVELSNDGPFTLVLDSNEICKQ
jgi:D-tyrosyl-tRNA(Tyr) deacylase